MQKIICFKIFITINNPDNFFETIIQTCSIKDWGGNAANNILHKWKQYRDQLDFGFIEFDTRSQKYKILNTSTIQYMILVSATSGVQRITLLVKVIFLW